MAGRQGATQTEDGGTGSFCGPQQDALSLGLLGVGVVCQGDDWGVGSVSPSLNFPYPTKSFQWMGCLIAAACLPPLREESWHRPHIRNKVLPRAPCLGPGHVQLPHTLLHLTPGPQVPPVLSPSHTTPHTHTHSSSPNQGPLCSLQTTHWSVCNGSLPLVN